MAIQIHHGVACGIEEWHCNVNVGSLQCLDAFLFNIAFVRDDINAHFRDGHKVNVIAPKMMRFWMFIVFWCSSVGAIHAWVMFAFVPFAN